MKPSSGLLITDIYRDLNSELHKRAGYGAFGGRWSERVVSIMREHHCKTVLDYGCGKGTLKQALDLPIAEYDPAIPEKSERPSPADLVVCTDVLEHIEPDLIQNVLADLASLSKRCCFVNISTRPAGKFLADGRNAHLLVESPEWWHTRLSGYFIIQTWEVVTDEVNGVLFSSD